MSPVDVWRRNVFDARKSWGRFENGTCVILAVPGDDLAGRAVALMREWGPVHAVVVLGHPESYPGFGFSAKMAGRRKSPFSGPAFMAVELVPGAREGVQGEVRYPPPFEGP